jgi:hypothetical protein
MFITKPVTAAVVASVVLLAASGCGTSGDATASATTAERASATKAVQPSPASATTCKDVVNSFGSFVDSLPAGPGHMSVYLGDLAHEASRLRSAAGTQSDPAVKDAIERLASDVQSIQKAMASGKTPDNTSLLRDAATLGKLCP